MKTGSAPKIDTIGQEVAEMQEAAAVCRAVFEGRETLIKGGEAFLPRNQRESKASWETRMKKTDFFPAFRQTLNAYIGKPLGSSIVVTDPGPIVEAALENIDLAGHDLDTFARKELTDGLIDGITFVVADYPVVPAGSTIAQERALGARPYLVHVPLSRVVDFRGEIVAGQHRLTHFRYRECVSVTDGRWGTKEAERIRVLEPGLVEVWEKRKGEDGKDGWFLIPELSGPVSIQEVPVAAYVPQPEGWFEGCPPMRDLADLNLIHWQSSSEQRHILSIARVPILAADEDGRQDQNAPVEIGVSGIIVGLKNFGYREHSGKAIEAGRTDILDLEDKLRRVAGQPLDAKVKTASESQRDSRDGDSQLRAWILSYQDHLEECLRLMSAWLRESQGGTVSINMDWDEQEVDATLLSALTNARNAGHISKETYLWNLQRSELLPPDVTIEEEVARLEMEGPQPMPGIVPFRPTAPTMPAVGGA